MCTVCSRRKVDVATLADLQDIEKNLAAEYRLVADIDAAETKNWNDGMGFAPIGNEGNAFEGVLDGVGHTIRNLHINRPTQSMIGLFGHLGGDGMIRNVRLVDAQIFGRKPGSVGGVLMGDDADDGVGSLVGSSNGNIETCQVSGKVRGKSEVGGLVGINEGSVTKCQAFCSVAGGGQTGGLVGRNGATITQCQASGAVDGAFNSGGLVGHNSGVISNCQAFGHVSRRMNTGGLVGFDMGSLGSIDVEPDERVEKTPMDAS